MLKYALIGAICVASIEAGQGATGGFRWGDWSDWEGCKKLNKAEKRRRICLSSIPNRKMAKENCIASLGTSVQNIETRDCTESAVEAYKLAHSETDGGIERMSSGNQQQKTKWQQWQTWGRCKRNERIRTRLCGDAFKRAIQPNRVCKNNETNGRSKIAESNKQVEKCGDEVEEEKNDFGGLGSRTSHSDILNSDSFSRLNVGLSAPECYLKPGSKVPEASESASPDQRIVGGRPSTHGENPHIVMLSYKGFGGFGQFCDGSIIHNRYIVTAAHCFVGWDESPGTYEVVVGAYNKIEKQAKYEEKYHLESITCHESYRVSSRQIIFDICLLKVDRDIEFNEFVWPICLPDSLPPPNDGTYDKNCTVAGWGDTRFTGDERILNEVDVPVLTYDTCVAWYEAENILIDTEQHVCAGYEQGGLDACQGDSGGPFVCRRDTEHNGKEVRNLKVLTGIVSFGVGCAQAKNPGVYSNVNYFLPYIFQIIHDHDACFPQNPCQNGGVCIDDFHGYTCQCAGNFVGKTCETSRDEIDACFNHACVHGQCTVHLDEYVCGCDEDFTGRHCDILTNPCRIRDCNVGSCTLDANNNPSCVCPSGWTGEFCNIDIDECLMSTDECVDGAKCSNIDGGYECTCQSGYDGDGRSSGIGCNDIDECVLGLHNCGPSAVCTNQPGTFSCGCRGGFTGNPPAVRCAKTAKGVRDGSGSCTNIIHEFQHGIYLKYPNGEFRFNIECGMSDNTRNTMDQMWKNPALKHEISEGLPLEKSCVMRCNAGQIGQFPSYSKIEGGQAARIDCVPKKKTVWKPNKNQVRCFGCDPIPGAALDSCQVKGKKQVECKAKCANGNAGDWTIKCNKFRGKFQWAQSLLSVITDNCA